MRAAIYTRVSTEDQATSGTSLQSQREACEALAAERGYTVAMSERDDISGTTLDRPGLSRIREAVAARLVDAVLVYDPDRLTRKLAHLLVLQEEIERNGARLEFRTHDHQRTPEGNLMLQVKGVVAEYERTKILERTKRGLMTRAKSGKWCGGAIPFGYNYDAGALTINAAESELVRHAYMLAASGASVREVTRTLNAGDIRPHRGGEWQKSSVAAMLSSEVYVGRAWYAKRGRSTDEWIPLPVASIISESLFATVRDRIQRNRALLSGRPSHTYLLRGLCRCGCGARMAGDHGGGIRYYRCSGRCGARMAQAGRLEAAVYQAVTSTVGSPEALGALVSEHLERLRKESGNVAGLRRRVELLRRKAERGARALIHAATDAEEAAMRDELGKVRAALVDTETRLAEIGAGDAALESVESARREIAAALAEVDADESLRREFLRRIVQEVRVRESSVEIAVQLSSAPKRVGRFVIRAEVA